MPEIKPNCAPKHSGVSKPQKCCQYGFSTQRPTISSEAEGVLQVAEPDQSAGSVSTDIGKCPSGLGVETRWSARSSDGALCNHGGADTAGSRPHGTARPGRRWRCRSSASTRQPLSRRACRWPGRSRSPAPTAGMREVDGSAPCHGMLLLRLRGKPLAGMAIRGPGPDLHKRARGSEKVPGSPDPRSCRPSAHAVRDLLTSPTYRIRPNAAGGSCSGRYYRIPVVLLLRQHRPDAARHPVCESDLRLLRRHRRPLLRGVEQAYRLTLANNVPRQQGVGKRLSAAGPFGEPAADTTAESRGSHRWVGAGTFRCEADQRWHVFARISASAM